MALTEMAIDAPSRVCETQSGYLWYICSWTTPDYSGCCRVDPCRQEPIGCPPLCAPDRRPGGNHYDFDIDRTRGRDDSDRDSNPPHITRPNILLLHLHLLLLLLINPDPRCRRTNITHHRFHIDRRK
jgi:hypothetical protein